jgi:hypothetical protein
MHVVTLTRRLAAHQETYGRVLFDGRQVRYDGLTSVFRRHLERGIHGPQNRVYLPSDGLDFLTNLKHHFAKDGLQASEVMTC